MKKIIKLTQSRPEEIEVEVEFPVYARQYIDGDSWSTIIYRRTEHDGTCYAITEKSDGYEIEIEKRPFDPRSSIDYTLGRGQYACTPEEFETARAKAAAYLDRIPRLSDNGESR